MEVVLNKFPEALDFAAYMQERGELPRWCYLPHDFIRGFLEKRTTLAMQQVETIRLGVALSWWQHKAVYQFKAPLLKQIISQPEPTGILGERFLDDLPQWGGYVDMLNANHDLYEGFWWHFDAEADNVDAVSSWMPRLILFLLIRGEGLTVMYLTLGDTLRQAARGFIQDGLVRADKLARTIPIEMGAVDGVVNMLKPVINILLYLLDQHIQGPVVKQMPATGVNIIKIG